MTGKVLLALRLRLRTRGSRESQQGCVKNLNPGDLGLESKLDSELKQFRLALSTAETGETLLASDARSAGFPRLRLVLASAVVTYSHRILTASKTYGVVVFREEIDADSFYSFESCIMSSRGGGEIEQVFPLRKLEKADWERVCKACELPSIIAAKHSDKLDKAPSRS